MLMILSRSPWAENCDSIVEIAREMVESGEQIALLHIQDACLAATSSEHCEKLQKNHIQIYALKSDLQARGLLDKVNKKAKIIDYEQWVKLVMVEHGNIVSWTS